MLESNSLCPGFSWKVLSVYLFVVHFDDPFTQEVISGANDLLVNGL